MIRQASLYPLTLAGDNVGILATPAYPLDVGGAIRGTNIYNTGLTSGRVPYVTTGGLLTNSAKLTFDGDSLGLNSVNTNIPFSVSVVNGSNGYWTFSRQAGYIAGLILRTSGSNRWIFGANADSESGSAAGTNFVLMSYDDAANFIGTPFLLQRSNGVLTLTNDDAATNSITSALINAHNTSGTPASGFGFGHTVKLESSTTASQTAAQQDVLWVDATHATRNSLVRGTNNYAGSAVGYYGFWSRSGIDGTARTIILNATGDVTNNITLMYSVKNETSGYSGGVVNLQPNTSYLIYSDADATNTLTLTCASDGSLTVARTAGSQTYSVAVWGVWI